jgi:hypothetical protein
MRHFLSEVRRLRIGSIHIHVFTVGEPFGFRLDPRFEGIT